jgi:hypothetical protein
VVSNLPTEHVAQLGEIPVVDPLVALIVMPFHIFPWWGVLLVIGWLLMFWIACITEKKR